MSIEILSALLLGSTPALEPTLPMETPQRERAPIVVEIRMVGREVELPKDTRRHVFVAKHNTKDWKQSGSIPKHHLRKPQKRFHR